MSVNVRVKLDADKSLGYGHLLYCCESRQPVHIDELEVGMWWECSKCEKPLMLRTEKGFYLIGKDVSI